MQDGPSEKFLFRNDDFFICEFVSLPDNVPSVVDWIIIGFCMRGSVRMRMDDKDYAFGKNDIIFALNSYSPDSVVVSPDFEGRIIGCSRNLVKRVVPVTAKLWDKAFYLYRNMGVHFEDDEMRQIDQCYQYVKSLVTNTDLLYYDDILRCVAQSHIYLMASLLDRKIGTGAVDRGVQSKDFLCKEFFELLSSTRPRPRSVSWYGERLHKTPKYLSKVVKEVSGTTASEWIHRAVVADIVDMLTNSSKSIKEICNELDFPNLSFFGRYVHTHLGMSPKEFRSKMR